MSVSRTQLLSRKRDLFAALHALQRDYDDGLIDEAAYRSAVHRYETEAAGILERLDTLPPGEVSGVERPPVQPWSFSKAFAAGTVVLVLIGIGLFLVAATHRRTGNQAITGSEGAPAAASPVSPQVQRAEAALRAHPRSVAAMLALGNAYFDGGDLASADRAYVAAMQAAPANPQPQVLHAMVLGMNGRSSQAHVILNAVERGHPAFARAWLLDGLFAPHTHAGYARAIAAWNRFLALQPHGTMTAEVRRWIVAARRSERAARR